MRLERFGAPHSPEKKGDGDDLGTSAPPITAMRGGAAHRDLGIVGTAQSDALVRQSGVVELLTAGDAALITMVAAVRIDETALREIFVKFLDERSKAAGAQALSVQQKDELFDQFVHGEKSDGTH